MRTLRDTRVRRLCRKRMRKRSGRRRCQCNRRRRRQCRAEILLKVPFFAATTSIKTISSILTLSFISIHTRSHRRRRKCL